MRTPAVALLFAFGAACADGVPVEPPASTPQTELQAAAVAEEAPKTDGRLVLEALSADAAAATDENERPRIGVHRKLPQPLPGVWSEDADGPVWRLTVRSPGAVALRLHFVDCDPKGGAVLVYEPDEKRRPAVERRYDDAGPAGDGEFWSDVLEGDAAVIEFRPAASRPEALPFRVEEISHLWRSPLDAF